MERTGIKVAQSATPMVAMAAALLLLIGGVPYLLRSASGSACAAKADPSLAVESAETYQEYAHATDLLLAGQEATVARMIDSKREQALVLNAGGHGDGALATFSPTTI